MIRKYTLSPPMPALPGDTFAVVAGGEEIAVVVDYSSGTINTSNCIAVRYQSPSGYTQRPFAYTVDGGGAAFKTSTTLPVFGYGSASKAFGYPMTAGVTATASSGEIGFKFALPAGWGSTFKVLGVRLPFYFGASGLVWTPKLYDGGGAGDTTVLQTADNVATSDLATLGNMRGLEFYFDKAGLATLTFGNTYRIALAKSSGVGGIGIGFECIDVSAAPDPDAFTLTFTNDRAGATYGATWQTLMSRLFQTPALILPYSGTPTILDTLITGA